MCVTTNGLFAGVYGPYDARKNDADILAEIMEQQGNIFQNLREGDVMVLDRGFRDCVRKLQERRFVVKIPTFTKNSSTQLTRTEANNSRMVTKVRFVVEVRNSHIKNIWKHLDGVKNYQSIPYLKHDFRIGAALVNAFCSKIESDQNDWEIVANQMLTQFDEKNVLTRNVFRIPDSAFKAVNNLTIYPKLEIKDLKCISQGSYQINQARSYCQSHLKANNGNFVTKICCAETCRKYCSSILEKDSNPLLLMANISSRFQSSKIRKTHVLLDLNARGIAMVIAYCCTCPNGLRTVGCCSHVMAIVWYTLYIEKQRIPLPSKNLDHILDEITSNSEIDDIEQASDQTDHE